MPPSPCPPSCHFQMIRWRETVIVDNFSRTLSGVAGLRIDTLLWWILIWRVKSECKSSMYSVTGEKLASFHREDMSSQTVVALFSTLFWLSNAILSFELSFRFKYADLILSNWTRAIMRWSMGRGPYHASSALSMVSFSNGHTAWIRSAASLLLFTVFLYLKRLRNGLWRSCGERHIFHILYMRYGIVTVYRK